MFPSSPLTNLRLWALMNRKPYIAVALTLSGFGFFALSIVEMYHEQMTTLQFFWTHISVYFVYLIFYSLYDGAVDGFIAESISKSKAGLTQGIVNGSRGIGVVIAFLAFGYMADALGWDSIFYLIGALLIICAAFIPLLREVPAAQRDEFQWAAFRIFRERRIQATCVYVFLTNMPTVMTFFLLPLFLSNELNFTNSGTSLVLGLAALFTAISAPVTGWLIDKYRHHFIWIFLATVLLGVVSAAGFMLSKSIGYVLVYPLAIAGGCFIGNLLACNLALVMIQTEPAIASSFFAIMVTVWTAGEILGLSLIGPILEQWGYLTAWGVILVIMLVAMPCLAFMFPKSHRIKTPIRSSDNEPPVFIDDQARTKIEDFELSSLGSSNSDSTSADDVAVVKKSTKPNQGEVTESRGTATSIATSPSSDTDEVVLQVRERISDSGESAASVQTDSVSESREFLGETGT